MNIKECINGTKVGNLSFLELLPKVIGKRRIGMYKCNCGKIVSCRIDQVGYSTFSCGCLQRKIVSQITTKRNTSHGKSRSRFYRIFKGMKDRCTNSNTPIYRYYGGRGIEVIWKSFEEFEKDMYDSYLHHCKYNSYTSIDRINNNGNYCKENCRWATRSQQIKNRNKFSRKPSI